MNSPRDFSWRFKKNVNPWKKKENEEYAIDNFEENVTLLYFTNNKGRICWFDLTHILPILNQGNDTTYSKSIFIYNYNPLK